MNIVDIANSSRVLHRGWRRNRVTAMTFLVSSMLVLAACSSSHQPNAGSGASSAKHSVSVALAEEPRTLGSWDAFASDGQLLYNVEEPLVMFQPPNYKLQGVLATSWKRLNPTTVQFQLRHNVKFQDGSPFDAKAAAFGINYTFSKKNDFEIREFMTSQITAHAVSKYVVDVESASPDPILANRMAYTLIPSMKQIQTDPGKYGSDPIGTGPYSFVQWSRGQYVKLKANPSWWGLNSGQRLPIQNATFTFDSGSEARAAAVAAGSANIGQLVLPSQCKASCKTAPDLNVVFLRFDYKNPVLHSELVRKAIALGVNVPLIAKRLVPGGIPRATVDPSFVAGGDPSLHVYPYNLSEAKSLIKQAETNGVPVKSTPLQIVVKPGYVPNQDNIQAYLEQQLKALGLNVSIKTYTQDQVESGLVQRNYSPQRGWILLWMHNTNTFDMADFAVTYLMCPNGAFGDASGYCDPTLDRMLSRASVMSGPARAAAFKAADDYAYNHYAVVAIASPSDYYVVSPGLKWQPRQDLLILLKDMSWS